MSEQLGCCVSFETFRITHLDVLDDAVIFAEATEVLAEGLESLFEEAEPLRLRVTWKKTKIQAFGDILGVTLWVVRMWNSCRRLPTLAA